MQKEEQILISITGQDRPGLTASAMGILARYNAQILDIGPIRIDADDDFEVWGVVVWTIKNWKK